MAALPNEIRITFDPRMRRLLEDVARRLVHMEERIDLLEERLRDVYGWQFDAGEEDEWSRL